MWNLKWIIVDSTHAILIWAEKVFYRWNQFSQFFSGRNQLFYNFTFIPVLLSARRNCENEKSFKSNQLHFSIPIDPSSMTNQTRSIPNSFFYKATFTNTNNNVRWISFKTSQTKKAKHPHFLITYDYDCRIFFWFDRSNFHRKNCIIALTLVNLIFFLFSRIYFTFQLK